MDEFLKLEEMVKVYEKNVETLHRHLIGQNWFGDHEQLEDYYNHLFGDVDLLAELGLAWGVEEPTMLESYKYYQELEIKDRDAKDSYTIVKGYFDDIVAQINRITLRMETDNIPADVINKLQELQIYYRVEATFKLSRAIKY